MKSMTYEPTSHNLDYVKYDYGHIPPLEAHVGGGVEALAHAHRKKF